MISPMALPFIFTMPATTPIIPSSNEYGIIGDSITNTSGQEHSGEIEDIVNRRDFNRKALRVATAAFLAPEMCWI